VLPKSKLWAIALLIAVAAAGFALGAFTTDYTHRPPPRDGRGREGGYAAHLAGQLGLDSVQTDSVRTILQHYRPAMRAVFDQVRPQMDSLRDRMRSDIHDVLTPDQRQRFDSLQVRERAMRERAAQGGR
jgi:Spy/CpxP family protein refolding chaperone